MNMKRFDISRPKDNRAILWEQLVWITVSIVPLAGLIASQAVVWYGVSAYGWADSEIFSIPTAIAASCVIFIVMLFVCGDPAEAAQWSRRLAKYDHGRLCPRVLEWQQRHDDVLAYCRRVTATGRVLTYYDYIGLQDWVEKMARHEAQEKAAEACRAIHSV